MIDTVLGTPSSQVRADREDPEARSVPLCVDLDGTLTPADTLHHLLRRLALTRPLACWDLPWWAMRGRSEFKSVVCDRIELRPMELVYRESVLQFLEEQRSVGRPLILATAAEHRMARAVADHLGIFGTIIATRRGSNLKGAPKLAAIRSEIGPRFDYVGDSMVDLPIFEAARESILVSPSRRLVGAVEALGIRYRVIAD
jgi:hypothetical protein